MVCQVLYTRPVLYVHTRYIRKYTAVLPLEALPLDSFVCFRVVLQLFSSTRIDCHVDCGFLRGRVGKRTHREHLPATRYTAVVYVYPVCTAGMIAEPADTCSRLETRIARLLLLLLRAPLPIEPTVVVLPVCATSQLPGGGVIPSDMSFPTSAYQVYVRCII